MHKSTFYLDSENTLREEMSKTELEKALIASETRYRRLFESTKDGILILDSKTGKIVDVNPFLMDLLGYSRKEFIEKSIWEIGFFKDIYKNREKFLELQQEEYIRYEDLPLETADGRKINVEFVSNVYLVNNNKVIQCNIRDITARKGKEDSLKETHLAISDSLNILLKHTHAPIIIWDASFIIKRFNRKFELLSGYDSDEVIGKKIDLLFPKEKIDATFELLKSHLDDEQLEVVEIDILTKDNIIKTVLWNSARIFDEEGKNIIATISQDITSRKRTEDALNLLETRYRRLFESAKDGILILDAESGKIVDVNPFLIELLGYSKEEFIEKSIWEIGAFQDIYENKEKFLELQQKEYVRYDNLPLETSDGRKIYAEFVSNVYLANYLKVIQCNIRDNTERHQIQNEINFQADLINNVGQAVIATDLQGTVTYWNNAAGKIYGWSTSEAMGQNIMLLTPAQQSNEQAIDIMKKLSEGKTWAGEFLVKRKDGSIFPAFVTDTPILDTNGRLTGIIGISSDITERKHAEKELLEAKEKAEESDRLKSAFLANMSHEIRTPMNGILGFAELLKDHELRGEKQQEYINIIEKSGARMLNIINDIISISKLESQEIEVILSDTNINEQVEYIYNFFKPEADHKKLHISYKNVLPENEARIRTDPEKIYAVLTNLVKNAIKFTQTGSIELGYDVKGEILEFFVKDSGSGVPPEQKDLIFERFRQGSEALNRNYEGAGLGLSISKAYVEMLGGKIWMENNTPEPSGRNLNGSGSTFFFTIPRIPVQEAIHFRKDNTPDELTKNETRKLNVLIVEDDRISEMLLIKMVENFAAKVFKATTGLEAIEVCRKNPDIDLVLMDINMPLMNGYAATRKIRGFNRTVVIIAQTAYALSGDKEKSIAAGCNDYISKPIDRVELKKMVCSYFN